MCAQAILFALPSLQFFFNVCVEFSYRINPILSSLRSLFVKICPTFPTSNGIKQAMFLEFPPNVQLNLFIMVVLLRERVNPVGMKGIILIKYVFIKLGTE